MENELQKIREGVLALMDKKLVPSPSTDESKAFYYKMKSDCYRHFAEFATGETNGKAGEDACDACVVATEIAEKDLVVTNPVRLAMALSSVVAQRQIPMDQIVQKTVETSQQQCIDMVSDGPVVLVEHVPQSDVAEKTVEIPQLDIIEKIVDTPVPQIVEELAEISKIFPQDRVQQSSTDQIIEILHSEDATGCEHVCSTHRQRS